MSYPAFQKEENLQPSSSRILRAIIDGLKVKHCREIIRLAMPTVVTMLSHTLLWTVDTALLGHFSSLAMASAGLGGILTWAVYCLFNNLSRITSTFVAQAHGKNDDRCVGDYLWQGIYLSVVTGTILQVLGYYSYLVLPFSGNPSEVQELTYTYIKWRALSAVPTQLVFCLMGFFQGRKDVNTPMWAGIVANLINLLLDVWLIFGYSGLMVGQYLLFEMPALGVKGAAMATSIATVVNAAILFWFVVVPSQHRKRYAIHIPRRLRWIPIKDMIAVGIPSAWEAFVEMSAFGLFSVLVGRLGAISLAANQITIQLLSFSFMPMWGLTIAGTILIGNAIGSRETQKAENYGRQVYKLGIYYTLALALFLVLAGRSLYTIFTNDPEVLQLSHALVLSAAFFQIGDGLRMVSLGLLSGAGDTRVPMLISILVNWGLFLPSTYILVTLYSGSVVHAWESGIVFYLLQAGLLYLRFRTGKWRDIQIFSGKKPAAPNL